MNTHTSPAHADPKPSSPAAIIIALIGAVSAICVAYISAGPAVQARVKEEIKPYQLQVDALSHLTNLSLQVELLNQQAGKFQGQLQKHETDLIALNEFEKVVRKFMADQKQIEAGTAFKAGENVEIKFSKAFQKPPIVVISPRFRNAVKNVDTITHISETGFTINSANGERDFFINYLAMER